MSHPAISIVTASLNSGSTIRHCLESIHRQRFDRCEHIVCDGGSTDDTIDALMAFARLYPLRWFSEPDRGIADALNKGIARATGHYILILQADDVLLDHSILSRVEALIHHERHDIASFQVIRDRPDATPFLYGPIRIPGWYRFKHTIPHQGAFVHRRLFDKIGGFREQFSIAMDYDFFYRAFQAGASIRYYHRPVSRMGAYGISSSKNVLLKRLSEEEAVQEWNETNPFWRSAQKVFRWLYIPYKTRRLRWRQLVGTRSAYLPPS